MGRSSLSRLGVAALAGATIAGCNILLVHKDDGYSGGASSSSGGSGGRTTSSSGGGGTGGTGGTGVGGTGGTGGTMATHGVGVWATALGAAAGESSTVAGIGVDDAGNVYATGSFTGALGIANCPLSSPAGVVMGYVLKLGPDGACMWSMSFGGADGMDDAGIPEAAGTAIAVSPEGDFAVAGKYSVATTGAGLPMFPAPSGTNAFVIRYPSGFDPAKSVDWSQRIGDTGDQVVTSLALDGPNVHVAGWYTDTMKTQSSGTANLSGLSTRTGFLMTLGVGGVPTTNPQPKALTGLGGDVELTTVAATSANGGMLALGGRALAGLDYCDGPKANGGGSDGFFARYAPASFSCSAGGWLSDAGNQYVHQTIFGIDGDIYVAGSFVGTIDFQDVPPLSNATGMPAAFLAHLGADGLAKAAIAFGTIDAAAPDAGVRIAVHPGDTAGQGKGDIVLAGTLRGDASILHTMPGSVGGGDNVVVARIDGALGTASWVRAYGGSQSEGADAVAVTKGGDIIIAGHFGTALDFGGGVKLNASPGADVFIAKLTP